MQLPSNKIGGLFLIVVIAVVLVIGGDVFFEKIKKDDAPEIVDADLVIRRNTTDNSSVDFDNDGLLDWQESLYGSSPKLFDTDGDGTNDGDEVQQGRDPSVAGPNDSLVNSGTIINTEFEASGYTPGSLTDSLSKDLFTDYLNLKQTNSLTQDSSVEIANKLSNQINSEISLENIYTKEDLDIVEGGDDALVKYGNDFAQLNLDYLTQIEQLDTSDNDFYLNTVALKYKQLSGVLTSIKVPSVAASVHVQTINNLYNHGVAIEEAALYESDPLKSLLATQKVQKIYESEVKNYKSLANYFKDNDIIFIDNEVSRFWNLFE
jgi:hypothetical protein